MNRLQKKCLIATAGFHLLLVLTIVFGSAFFTSHTKPDDTQLLDVIPANLIDAAFNSGVKNAQQPASTPVVPPQPTPVPPQPKAVVTPPTPPAPTLMQRVEKIFTPETPKLPPDDTMPVEKPAKPQPHKINVDLSKQVMRTVPKATPDTSDADAREAAKEAKRRAKAIANVARAIKENSSSVTTVEMKGESSVSYAAYGSAIKSIYDHAWILPGNVDYGNASTKIKVVISRDGQVISSRIIESSGNSALDDSAQRALDRVTDVPPFPEGDQSLEHTYTFSFNPLTKQMSE